MIQLLFIQLMASMASAAVSNLHIPQTGITIAINLPPNSNDINFYVTAPLYYSWVGIGFGSQMANSLMLIAYPGADGRRVVVSPRVGSGNWEPKYNSGFGIYLNGNSTSYGNYLVASGTCINCRSWPGGYLNSNTQQQPMLYALGPHNTRLATNDPKTMLKRHSVYGRFYLNTAQATGYGGTGVLTSINNGLNTGTQLVGAIVGEANYDHIGVDHGSLMAVAGLVLAPMDVVLSATSRLGALHVVVSLLYLFLLAGGLGLGVSISRQYVSTQHYNTSHQIVGFIVFFLGVMLLGLGLALHAARMLNSRSNDLPNARGPVHVVHMWGVRVLWILLLINAGVGLQLAQASRGLTVAYSVLAGACFLGVISALACIWCIGRGRKRGGKQGVRSRAADARRSFASRKTSSGDSEPTMVPAEAHTRDTSQMHENSHIHET